MVLTSHPVSILYKSIAGRYRPVSYPDGPITACYRFIKNDDWAVNKYVKSFSDVASEFVGLRLDSELILSSVTEGTRPPICWPSLDVCFTFLDL